MPAEFSRIGRSRCVVVFIYSNNVMMGTENFSTSDEISFTSFFLLIIIRDRSIQCFCLLRNEIKSVICDNDNH